MSKRTGRNKSVDYIAEIVVNIILISIWGKLPEWFSFLNDSFYAILPLFYISFIFTIVVNTILLVNLSMRLAHLLKTVTNFIAVIVLTSIYYIFPFDFSSYSGNWELVARIIILLAIFGTTIATIVELIATIFSKNKMEG